LIIMSKIPGFRSGKVWKKIIATVGYIFIALIAIGMIFGDDPKPTTPTTAIADKTPEQIAQEKEDAELKAKQEAEAKEADEAKEKADADAKAKQEAEAKAAKEKAELEAFNNYVKILNGSSFIKSAELTDGKATIAYTSSYDEYKSINPNSKVTLEQYNNYWETGDAVNKTLMDIPVRLMCQFTSINKVSVTLLSNNKQYTVALDRSTAEKYFSLNLNDLQPKEVFTEKFVNQYVYNKDERAKFAKQFISSRS